MQNRTGKSGPVIILKAYRLNEVHSKMTMKSIVILSERSESKDLRTHFTANAHEMRRFLDSAKPRSK